MAVFGMATGENSLRAFNNIIDHHYMYANDMCETLPKLVPSPTYTDAAVFSVLAKT